jgi:hypothetical protein
VLTHAIHLGHFENQGLFAKDAINVNRICALLFILGKFNESGGEGEGWGGGGR